MRSVALAPGVNEIPRQDCNCNRSYGKLLHMARFLIEVPHESEAVSCARANKVLLESGSHFLTHADMGCRDGVHKAWIVVDVDSKDEARNLLPPLYRREATIVQLSKFGLKELDDFIKLHEGR
jgi:hypothetical protein